jgi:hypothetical protein
MRTIWKFPFEIADDIPLELPVGAEVVHVDTQGGQPCIWALVDPEAPKEKQHFRIHGTGHPIDDPEFQYVASFQQSRFVWHLFRKET